MNPRPSLFHRLFGAGPANTWEQRAAWEAQKLAWKAQRQAQKAAWRAQHNAQRSAWKVQTRALRGRYREPFAALWSMVWSVFWLGLLLLLIISPEFRSRVMQVAMTIPEHIVHVLYGLVGRSEI